MKPIVFIDGDQGTTGLQIQARLSRRQDLRLVTLPQAQRKDPQARAGAINDCDIAILCLPDQQARQAVASLTHPEVRVIDASSAHRVDPAWTYGFAELAPGQASRIATARRVSNPGCYPTGALALLRPLVDAGLLPADHPLAIHAVSGYSGGGRQAISAHEGPDAALAPSFRVYGLSLSHKHIPEIQAHAGLAERPVFLPAYGAFRQGIVLTIPLHLRHLPKHPSAAELRDCLGDRYKGNPAISVLSQAQSAEIDQLDPQACNGSDRLQIAVFENEHHHQVLLSAVFDNLGKGASGAAVQNLDLMISA